HSAHTSPSRAATRAAPHSLPTRRSSDLLSLATDENATCKWATAPNTSYGSMPNTFTTTGGLSHSTLRTGLTNGSAYTSYVRCQDAPGSTHPTDHSLPISYAHPAYTHTPL